MCVGLGGGCTVDFGGVHSDVQRWQVCSSIQLSSSGGVHMLGCLKRGGMVVTW